MPVTIKVAAGHYHAEKRTLGQLNIGFYCNNCDEFFAVAVAPKGAEEKLRDVILDLDPNTMFECPMCHEVQARQSSEVARIVLTPDNKRRPPRPAGAH